MNVLRKITSQITGKTAEQMGNDDDILALSAANIPVSVADCRTCANPCQDGHADYPNKFAVDYETDMRGSVKPYRRQVVISTGKTDWEREVTDTKGTLAAHLWDAHARLSKQASALPANVGSATALPTGIFRTAQATNVSILNGSHNSVSDDHDQHTVIVLPDYTAVCDVAPTPAGAELLWRSALDPAIGRAGTLPEGGAGTLKTWTLPYNCVILLCSHKRRDNKCGIAAPKLETAFTQSLLAESWDVDTQIDHLASTGPPLEDLAPTPKARAAEALQRLKETSAQEKKRALIIQNSHIGGHKFAGNVIIYTPQGAAVWYGRVTPHEVPAIVQKTLLDGFILPTLLRGGLDVARRDCRTLNDW